MHRRSLFIQFHQTIGWIVINGNEMILQVVMLQKNMKKTFASVVDTSLTLCQHPAHSRTYSHKGERHDNDSERRDCAHTQGARQR